ncbi:MAG: elongation factor Ts [Sphaerochaeta sp.]|nr:elongation factor Ts [Sphaerochaeta sp.]
MAVTAEDVKRLRDATGAGMMDCKKALMKSDGDFDAANKFLKEMGLAAIAKRQDRATNNGRVFVRVTDDKAVIVQISCETDFVAGNAQFAELGENVCTVVVEKGYTEINDELNGMVNELITVIKENMTLKQVVVLPLGENEFASSYVHGEGSLGVVVTFKTDKASLANDEVVKEFANDCALHVAAFTPSYFTSSSVDPAYVADQTEIFTAQAALLDKPAKVVEGIVKGKLSKHLAEICFLQQKFVKDDSVSVEQKAKEVSKTAGGKIEISNFTYILAGSASCEA